MNTSVTGRSLLDDVEYELEQIRKFVNTAAAALASEGSHYVAHDVADMLDHVIAERVNNLLEEIAERRLPPQGPPTLRLVPRV
jgi:hypothetical protein